MMPERPAQRMKSTDEYEKIIEREEGGAEAEKGQYSHDLQPPGQSRCDLFYI